jgi:bifunctional non-homologous end joining protein LigD
MKVTLETYRAKRDRDETPEPFGRIHIPPTGKLFVVQQHAARHLHWDFRVEVDGVLKSWAVPKGPSNDLADKRFAVQTEDHPLDYADFEGKIPEGNYGAGHVIVWDRGRWRSVGDFAEGLKKGKLLFELEGYKMQGRWTMVRLKSKSNRSGNEWLLIKERDAYTSDDGNTLGDTSVLSGLNLKQLANPSAKQASLRRALGTLTNAEKTPASQIPTKPMLAQSGDAFDRAGWIWELKYDGYRIIAKKDASGVHLITRNGHQISGQFPEICQVLTHLPLTECILDGELVVQHEGRPSFALMQTRARSTSHHEVAKASIELPATFYAFDALNVEGVDLRKCPLTERKRILRRVIPPACALVYSEHVDRHGVRTYAAAKELGIEGVVGKKAASPYRAGRSAEWIKVRNQRSGDFIVVGWSAASGDPSDVGSLALAEYRSDGLRYVGHAGSGLGSRLRKALGTQFKPLKRKTCPLVEAPKTKKTVHWLRPRLVVEVAYTEYTPYGHLRHPSILRVRDDKEPHECTSRFDLATEDRELDAPAVEVVVTNEEKVFFPDPAYTKGDLVDYYKKISRWMLPYLKDRPIVLTRYPDGIDGKSFYQRDVPDYVPDWIQREVLWSESTEREVHYFVVRTAEDLAYIANMGTIAIHMWHSRMSNLEKADWCVLDLDPKTAPFADVITLARTIGEIADSVELPAYPKTSGASGMHVLIPLGEQLTHDQSRTLGELIARLVVKRHPDIATIARTVRARKNKVYVDFMQNGHGRLIVAPFSVRAEPAASVSMPITWSEVNAGLRNDKFHIGNAVRRMQRRTSDPLSPVLTDQPDLIRALHKLAELVE